MRRTKADKWDNSGQLSASVRPGKREKRGGQMDTRVYLCPFVRPLLSRFDVSVVSGH